MNSTIQNAVYFIFFPWDLLFPNEACISCPNKANRIRILYFRVFHIRTEQNVGAIQTPFFFLYFFLNGLRSMDVESTSRTFF